MSLKIYFYLLDHEIIVPNHFFDKIWDKPNNEYHYQKYPLAKGL